MFEEPSHEALEEEHGVLKLNLNGKLEQEYVLSHYSDDNLHSSSCRLLGGGFAAACSTI